jgi:hypothetical protein
MKDPVSGGWDVPGKSLPPAAWLARESTCVTSRTIVLDRAL